MLLIYQDQVNLNLNLYLCHDKKKNAQRRKSDYRNYFYVIQK